MRAFHVTWRTFVSYYNELFLLIGTSLMWWVSGGIAVGLAAVAAWTIVQVDGVNGAWWLAPILAIPAGPASAALAQMSHEIARERSVDRSVFWQGFRSYWRQALGLNAISMVILGVLCFNLLFYLSQANNLLRTLAFLWGYLILFWLSVQLYLFPTLVGLKQPTILGALRTATVAAFANPLFSVVLFVLAALLTALSVVLAILVLIAWPALMALLGSHSLKLMVERAGIKPEA